MTSADDEADIKIVDFGFAAIAHSESLLQQCGTPDYIGVCECVYIVALIHYTTYIHNIYNYNPHIQRPRFWRIGPMGGRSICGKESI
jgi:hypothetical protein